MIRLWLLIQGEGGSESVILTGPDLARRDIHPLRCVYLGRFSATNDPAALSLARSKARESRPEAVISRNIRVACDRRQTRRWRLSAAEIDGLRAGGSLTVRDGLGVFAVAYSEFD